MTGVTDDHDPTCAASGAGCDFVFMERFKSWGCKYCGRGATAEETTVLSGMTEAHPVKQPLTLDDVSARIKQICDNHVTNCARAKGELDRGVGALAADVEAASHLDQNAVAMIVFGQLKVMMTELQEVAG